MPKLKGRKAFNHKRYRELSGKSDKDIKDFLKTLLSGYCLGGLSKEEYASEVAKMSVLYGEARIMLLQSEVFDEEV